MELKPLVDEKDVCLECKRPGCQPKYSASYLVSILNNLGVK